MIRLNNTAPTTSPETRAAAPAQTSATTTHAANTSREISQIEPQEAPTRPGTPINAPQLALAAPKKSPRKTSKPAKVEPWYFPNCGDTDELRRLVFTRAPSKDHYSDTFWMMERSLRALSVAAKSTGELAGEHAVDAEARVDGSMRSCLEMTDEHPWHTTSVSYDCDNSFVLMELDRDMSELLAAKRGLHRYCTLPSDEKANWITYLTGLKAQSESQSDAGALARVAYCSYELELLESARPAAENPRALSYEQDGVIRTYEEHVEDRNTAEREAAQVGYHRYSAMSPSDQRSLAKQMQLLLKREEALAGQREFDEKSRRR